MEVEEAVELALWRQVTSYLDYDYGLVNLAFIDINGGKEICVWSSYDEQ